MSERQWVKKKEVSAAGEKTDDWAACESVKRFMRDCKPETTCWWKTEKLEQSKWDIETMWSGDQCVWETDEAVIVSEDTQYAGWMQQMMA